MMRREQRMGEARTRAYSTHDQLTSAVRRRAHPRRIAELTSRAIRHWDQAARLHRADNAWARVALWHAAALRSGVLDAGAPVPQRLPRGIDPRHWLAVPTGASWLYRAGLPHYWAGPAMLLDGSRWVPVNGAYRCSGGRPCLDCGEDDHPTDHYSCPERMRLEPDQD